MSHVVPVPATPSVPVVGAQPGDTFPVRRIYCVGRNYVDHAIEMGHTGREAPFFFLKPADAVLPVAEGTTGQMHYPSATKDLHHEVELVVAIGKGGRNIPAAQALDHVYGYAVGLDMTRRDLQGEAKKQGRPWCSGKGFDESAPIGPVRPAALCQVGADTRIELKVNGTLRQHSVIGKLIWNIPEIIEQLSGLWELAPGDLIFTGTPEGVAAVVTGDTLSAKVDGVGSLQVQLVAR
jgi:fumarylpyruvate hydrolase